MNLRTTSLVLFAACYCFGYVSSQKAGEDSECYTANGRDYEGSQSITYVGGSKVYDPAVFDPETCLQWAILGDYLNITKYAKKLQKNYCRNPNNRLFPYCYVMRSGQPEFSYCHIPTCNTPALLGCFKLTVREGGKAPGGLNLTADSDVILDGTDSLSQDPQMKIGRCLNFCRSKKYNYAGVTRQNSCLCGTESSDGSRLKEAINQIKPQKCLQYACPDDSQQACGGDDAIAIYDVEAGSCTPTPIHDRDSGVIYSPRWPGNYHNSANCQWTIYIPDKYLKDDETKKNYQLSLEFTYFNIENENDTVKLYIYRNSTDHGKLYNSYTGYFETSMSPIYFKASEVIAVHMIFNSDKDHRHKGFILKYSMIYTGPLTTTTVSTTTISTTTTPKPTTAKSTTTTPKATTTTTTPTTTTTTTTTTTKSTTSQAPTTTKGPTTGSAPMITKGSMTSKSTPKVDKPSSKIPSSTPQQTKNGTQPSKAVKQEKTSSLAGGAIAGIVIGVLIFIVLIAVAVILVRKRLWPEKPAEPATFNNPVNFNTDTPL